MSKSRPVPLKRVTSEVRNDVLGASAHAMGRAGGSGLAVLQAQPPAPPLWRRTHLYPYLLSLLVVVGLIGFEITMRLQIQANEQRLDDLETEFSQRLQVTRMAQATASEANRLKAQTKSTRNTVASLRDRKQALDGLLERQQSAPAMLAAFQEAVTDEVMLSEFGYDSGGDGLYYISAWALTNTAGQLFVNNLGRHLTLWNLRVQDYRIRTGTNRFKALGYEVEVWLKTSAKPGGKAS